MSAFHDVDCVLFDLDGTLVDTAPDLGDAANQVRIELGLPPLPDAGYRPVASAGARGLLKVALDMAPDHPEYPVRRDALLTGQARLINLFKKRDIWDNVIIVAKQSLNPESDCQVSDIWDNVIIVAKQSLKPESDCHVSDI